MKFQLFTWTEC